MNKPTAAQLAALRTCLRFGGRVIACMGKVRGNRVNKLTIDRLEEAGLITVRSLKNTICAGPEALDVTVRAAGCLAVKAADEADAAAALALDGVFA